jgi:hypothetical protein
MEICVNNIGELNWFGYLINNSPKVIITMNMKK